MRTSVAALEQKTNSKFQIALFLLTFLAGISFCNPANSAELTDYLEDLLDKSNQVKSYQAQKRQAKEMLWKAKSQYMPRVDLHSQLNKENIVREEDDNTYKERTYLSLKSTQLVTDFGKTSSGIAKARKLYQQADRQLNLISKQVLLEGITAYLQVVQAREKLKYAKRSEKNITEQTGMEETLVRKGAGFSSDVLQARAQLSGAKALRVRAEGDLEDALNRFQAVFHTRLNEDQIAALSEPKLPKKKLPSTKQEAVQRALENNPRLLVLKKSLKAAGEEVDIQKGNLFPRINLFAEYSYKDNDSGIDGYRKEAKGGIELTYNLFKSGGDLASINAARENKTSVYKDLKYQKWQVKRQAQDDWNSFLIQTRNHRFLQNQARIASEFLELAKKERKLGNRSLLDILSGETEYIRAVSDSVAAAISRKLSAYKLLYTTGDLSLKLIK